MDKRVHYISASVPELTVTIGSESVKIEDTSYGRHDQIVLGSNEALELYKILDEWLDKWLDES